mgnify:CR=1 FL=1
MNIAVCVKHIPDPNVPPEMDGKYLKREGVQGVLDPGDEFGVEAALQIKEAQGSGEVTLVSMAPNGEVSGLRTALAMGAAKGVLVSDPEAIRRVARERVQVAMAGGLGPLAGRVFRIGHLGDFNDLMLAGTLCGVEMGLRAAGVEVEHGVGAALELLEASSVPA